MFLLAGRSQTSGPAAISGGCNPGDFIYTPTIEASTVTFGNVLFQVKAPSRQIFRSGGATSPFAVLDTPGRVTAISITGPAEAMSSPWLGYGLTTPGSTSSGSTPRTNVLTIAIDQASASPTRSLGLPFVVLGAGSHLGTTQPVTLP